MENPQKNPTRIEQLRQRIARLQRARHRGDDPPVASGCGPLDRLLPQGGFRRGTLIEWLAHGQGAGAGTLALLTAREACHCGGAVVVIDQGRQFYPPAAARLGIDLENLIVVHADGQSEGAWALDQAMRCPGVAAVTAWPEALDRRTFRRLQLAAEEGGGLGLLIRPHVVRHEPSWADVRLLIQPLPSHQRQQRLRIHLLRCRGGTDGRSVDVEIDDETRNVHLVARLAAPTARRRTAGA